jgi:hypothetical protein
VKVVNVFGQEFPASFQQGDGEEELAPGTKTRIYWAYVRPNPIAEGGIGSTFPPYDY